jgi:uncharacterized RDD family membrane protein YckC
VRYRSAYGKRLLAGLIDLVLAAVPCFALFFVVSSTAPAGTVPPSGSVVIAVGTTERYLMGGPALAFVAMTLVIWVLLFGMLPAQTGATAGMTLLGLRVAGEDGAPVSLSRHLVRTALWLVDGFPYVIPGAVAFILIVITPTRRRFGDLAARTVVVRADDAATGTNF